jgi:hypothetical protein
VSSLFLVCEPLRGWRHVTVTKRRTKADWAHIIKDQSARRLEGAADRRTKADWAHIIKELVDVHYPDADTIVLVQDNLNTHTPAALYETFPPAEARRLAAKLELHYPPTHGSWLNIAEIELAILTKQVLSDRIPDPQTLTERTAAWHTTRNAKRGPVRWRFTTADARITLARLYPSLPV